LCGNKEIVNQINKTTQTDFAPCCTRPITIMNVRCLLLCPRERIGNLTILERKIKVFNDHVATNFCRTWKNVSHCHGPFSTSTSHTFSA